MSLEKSAAFVQLPSETGAVVQANALTVFAPSARLAAIARRHIAARKPAAPGDRAFPTPATLLAIPLGRARRTNGAAASLHAARDPAAVAFFVPGRAAQGGGKAAIHLLRLGGKFLVGRGLRPAARIRNDHAVSGFRAIEPFGPDRATLRSPGQCRREEREEEHGSTLADRLESVNLLGAWIGMRYRRFRARAPWRAHSGPG